MVKSAATMSQYLNEPGYYSLFIIHSFFGIGPRL